MASYNVTVLPISYNAMGIPTIKKKQLLQIRTFLNFLKWTFNSWITFCGKDEFGAKNLFITEIYINLFSAI